jgi:hypothetical protein
MRDTPAPGRSPLLPPALTERTGRRISARVRVLGLALLAVLTSFGGPHSRIIPRVAVLIAGARRVAAGHAFAAAQALLAGVLDGAGVRPAMAG